MNPFVPLWIACCIRLLVLGLEDSHDLPIRISRKITSGASLRDHAWMHLLPDCHPHAFDYCLELGSRHVPGLQVRHVLYRDGPHPIGRLKYGMMDLIALFLAGAVSSAALEAGRDFVGPALEPGIDGFEVDAGIAPNALAELGS